MISESSRRQHHRIKGKAVIIPVEAAGDCGLFWNISETDKETNICSSWGLSKKKLADVFFL